MKEREVGAELKGIKREFTLITAGFAIFAIVFFACLLQQITINWFSGILIIVFGIVFLVAFLAFNYYRKHPEVAKEVRDANFGPPP